MIVAIFTHISASFFILLCFNSCIPYFEYIINLNCEFLNCEFSVKSSQNSRHIKFTSSQKL